MSLPSSAVLALLAPVLAGCTGENLGSGWTVINDTDQPLFIYGDRLPPAGGTWFWSGNGCGGKGLKVRTTTGGVSVTLTEEICPDQSATISGPDEVVIRDDP